MGMVSPLISPAELAESPGPVRVLDMRWSLTDPNHGTRAYEAGHVPGAVFVDLDRDLAGTRGDGRHPLPPAEEFTQTLGRLGVGPAMEVVVYDDMAGAVAARMWWMMMSIGHRDVRVLDGGLQAWTDEGLPLETGMIDPNPTTYPDVPGYVGVVGHHELAGRIVADVRSPERYRGDFEPVDPKAGHIPGAINYPIAGNLEKGRFRSPRELAERFAGFPDDGIVSCGSGVNACHMALALNLAGRPMPDVYIGSFSDWASLDLPVNTGPNP
jgi:thiosulfate/3-mercaptopyruvate sulfurtransferase